MGCCLFVWEPQSYPEGLLDTLVLTLAPDILIPQTSSSQGRACSAVRQSSMISPTSPSSTVCPFLRQSRTAPVTPMLGRDWIPPALAMQLHPAGCVTGCPQSKG